MKHHKNSSLWWERYRPQRLNEIILTDKVRKFMEYCIREKDIPNILLYGNTGTGKTSFVNVLANELKFDYMDINGSLITSIEFLRNDITNFITTYGMDDTELPYKIVFIDEVEKISPQFQEALKVYIEEMENNARFIFNTNNITKVIKPLRGRFSQGTFNLIPSNRDERQKLVIDFIKKIKEIIKIENMEADSKVLAELVVKHFPDFRNIVGILQQYKILNGDKPIDASILELGKGLSDELLKALIDKDVQALRVIAIDTDPSSFFREFDMAMYNIIEDDDVNIVNATIILADFAYRNGYTTDELLNLKSCFMTLIQRINFKKNI